MLNTERSKDNIIATLVSDVVLLLTMLVGLLCLRKGGTLFGLGQLLWKQVGGAHLSLTDHRSYVLKGPGLALISNHCGGPSCRQSDRSPTSPAFDLLFFCLP